MKKQIKVSIIVPVFNTEKYLTRCLESLINQTLKDIEIICINDGSSDNSCNILEEYRKIDNRITVINQINSGQSVARNKGLEVAKGEYVGFVDSDDWVDLNFYEKLYNSAENNNADIAAAGIIKLNKFKRTNHLKISKEIVTDDVNEKFEICDIPEKSYVCNKIYKLEKFKQYNLKFEEGIIYEDLIFTPKAIYYLGKLAAVSGVNYYYWRNANSTVRRKDKKACNDSEYAHKKAKEFCAQNNIDISNQEVITKKYKLFGLSIFKTQTKNTHKTYILFNLIKIKLW